MNIVSLKKKTILAEARGGRRGQTAPRAALSLVRVGAEIPGAPSWWPSYFSWPALATSPPGWNLAVAWPPMTLADLTLGMSTTTAPVDATGSAPGAPVPGAPGSPVPGAPIPGTTAAIAPPLPPMPPPPSAGLSPAAKDGISAVGGAVIGGVMAKLAVGAAVGPIALGAAIGALLGHVAYSLMTGNPVTQVATRGCGCGGVGTGFAGSLDDYRGGWGYGYGYPYPGYPNLDQKLKHVDDWLPGQNW